MKIYKHFDCATPFSMAENDHELAEIMRLKYPKACSNLETGAEFFARMVKEVQQFAAWKVIGFSTFEEFCREELGKTLGEVEEIVEGVKLLGGNPTEAEAKKASKTAKLQAIMDERPEMTDAEIVRETGESKQLVSHARKSKEKVKPQSFDRIKTPVIGLATDPTRTAANIHAKMGGEYCRKLIVELETITK